MSTTITCPITLGGTYWRAVPASTPTTVPCPVCAGQKTIEIILGSGEHVTVPCEGCELGFNGPQGVITEYQQTPAVEQVIVDRISSIPTRAEDQWSFTLLSGGFCYEQDLFLSEAEAMAEAVRKQAIHHERIMENRQTKRKQAERAGWSVRYHREQIKDLQRQLTWHEAKVVSCGK